MKVDYILVGLGIAGITFSQHLLEHNKSFVVITDARVGATQISGGVFNPVVLRRFTAPKDTPEFIAYAEKTYAQIENYIQERWRFPKEEVHRIFASIEEQNNWFVAKDQPHITDFLAPEMLPNSNPSVVAAFGLGKVSQSFKIDPTALINAYQNYLLSVHKLQVEAFDYTQLKQGTRGSAFKYKNIQADKIVFAEGARIKNNPFVMNSVIRPNKGEYLIIKSPELQLEQMLKGGVYIIPLGKDRYKVGATYSPEDETLNPTENARVEIEAKLQKMITCSYEVVDQIAGTRPVTIDRQPVLGEVQESMFVFNGLGARGFTRGPLYAKILFDFIEKGVPIPNIMEVNRFTSSKA